MYSTTKARILFLIVLFFTMYYYYHVLQLDYIELFDLDSHTLTTGNVRVT